MTDENKKASEALANAGVTVASNVIARLTTTDPIAGAFVASGVGTAMNLARAKYTAWAHGRQSRWWDALLQDDTRSAEQVAEEVAAAMDDPKVGAAVTRAIRAALENPDEAVIAPLAALAKLHLGQYAVPMRFFRGAVETLERVTARELADLRRLMQGASSAQFDDADSVGFAAIAAVSNRIVRIAKPSDGKNMFRSLGVLDVEMVDPARMVQLLSTHALARRITIDDCEAAEMSRPDALQLARVFAAGATST